MPEFDDLSKSEERCTFSSVLENLSKNAFILMGKGSSIAEMIKSKQFPADDPNQLMVQSMTIGDDIGSFIQAGLNFIEP